MHKNPKCKRNSKSKICLHHPCFYGNHAPYVNTPLRTSNNCTNAALLKYNHW